VNRLLPRFRVGIRQLSHHHLSFIWNVDMRRLAMLHRRDTDAYDGYKYQPPMTKAAVTETGEQVNTCVFAGCAQYLRSHRYRRQTHWPVQDSFAELTDMV
jgi:hypothetical protein